MKKVYKLLIITLVFFFMGIVDTHADKYVIDTINGYGPSVDIDALKAKKAAIGTEVSSYLPNYIRYNKEYISGNNCDVTAYFNTMEDHFVKTKIIDNRIKITDDFKSGRIYDLYKLDINCGGIEDTIDLYKYSHVKNTSIFIQKQSPFLDYYFTTTTTTSYSSSGNYYHIDDKIPFKIVDSNNNGVFSNSVKLYEQSMVAYFKNSDGSREFSVPVSNLSVGDYEMDLKKATGNIKNNQEYYLYKLEVTKVGEKYIYMGDAKNTDYSVYALPSPHFSIKIYDELLDSISIDKNNVKYNETVYLNLKFNKKPLSGTIKFKNINTNEYFTSTIRDLDSKPYFVIPFSIPTGEYELDYISLKSEGDLIGYIDKYYKEYTTYSYFFNLDSYKQEFLKKYFDYNHRMTVEKDDGSIRVELLELENDKINDEILSDIKKIDGNIKINIDASNDSIISKELFDAIKGSDKTLYIKFNDNEWIVKGKDIKYVKDVNVRTTVDDASMHKKISKMVKDAVIINFSDNGILPGKMNVRIFNDKDVSTIIKNKDINLYFYNEKANKFELVKEKIKLTEDNYYELELSHNSKYVITNNVIKDRYLVGNNSNLVLIIIIVSIVCLLAAGLIVFLLLKNKKKKNKKESSETPLEEKTIEENSDDNTIEEEIKEENTIDESQIEENIENKE